MASKKTFVMTIKSTDAILNLDVRRPYDKKLDSEGEIAFYESSQDTFTRVLKMQK